VQDIFLIGGSPSSGSTLLVNLLNRYDGLVCLPETGLFSHGRNLLDLCADVTQSDLRWYLPWLLTSTKVAHSLGWRENEYEEATKQFPTVFELLRSRIDPERKYWLIEKTPENIFAFEYFLTRSTTNRVVVTSRDALSVMQSLMRRGFSMIEAILVWFAHSYETVRLMTAFPSQVYHCSFQRLTTEPDQVASEIVEFLEIVEPPHMVNKFSGSIVNVMPRDAHSSQSGSKSGAGRNTDGNSPAALEWLVTVKSWRLTDTSWSRSPFAKVEHSRPLNLLGLDFEVLMEQIAFRTRYHNLVRPMDVEKSLLSDHDELGSSAGFNGDPVKMQFGSTFTRTLAEHYVPLLIKS
jgi:hypothetical protein